MASDKRLGCFGWIGIAFVAAIALRVCARMGADTKAVSGPEPSTSIASSASARTPVKLPNLAAAKLWQDYKANEVKADLQYKGKRFHVTGTVVEIRSDFADDPQIELVTDLLGVTVSGLGKRFAATLNKGDKLEADCTVTGAVMGSPILDCS